MPVIRGLTAIAVLLLTAGAANAFELQGTTFCGGTRMVGATVQALFDGTQQEAGFSTTDGSGHYTLTLGANAYDLMVTPPVGSLCLPAKVDKNVTGDETSDIILTPQDVDPPPPTLIELSGTVLMDDAPMAGLTVEMYRPGGGNNYYYGITDATGRYAVTVPVGRWAISVYPEEEMVSPRPRWFDCYVPAADYGAASVKDMSVHTATVTGTAVTTPNPGVAIGVTAYPNSTTTQSGWSCSAGDQVVTNASGRFGPSVILANGPGYVSTSAVAGVYLSGSVSFTSPGPGQTVDVEVVVPQVQSGAVSGSLTLADGTGVADAEVQLYRSGNTYYGTTDEDGHFSVTVPFGTYSLEIGRYEQTSSDVPANVYCWAGQIAVSGPTSLSFVIRTGMAQGEVRLQGTGTPVPNVSVDVWSTMNISGSSSCESNATLTTDLDGKFGPVMMLGGATGGAYVAGKSGVYYGASTQFDIPDNGVGSGIVQLPPFESYTISGHVVGNGTPIASMRVLASGSSGHQTQTDSNGAFALTVPKGSYYVDFEKYGDNGPLEPWNLYCWASNVSVQQALALDRTMTWSRVTGRVTTESGIPIAGVAVVGDASFSDGPQRGCGSYWEGTTDNDGRYSYLLVRGSAYYGFTPIAGSGYKTIGLSSQLTGDLTQQVVLQLPDVVPPNLLGEPVVIHHSNTSVSIQWGTNEATNGRLEYQLGTTLDGSALIVDKPAYVTDHIVTLKDLLPLTVYAYRVTSKDAAGNPVTSGVRTFTTVELPDTDAPLITNGPSVTFLGPTQIRLAWSTNEPATSWVDYGLAGGARDLTKGNDDSALLHDVLVTGLTPQTSYTLVVRSSDPDGNGPTTSAPMTVTTPAVSDMIAPTVSSLRTECVTHERMAVCWDTDEPATSNVAYENQSTQAAGGISSGALVTSRCMSLTNLSPATSYRVSVSSADGGGNVGTGGPIFQTTGTNAADGAPVISAFRAEYTSPTAARVSWTTDVPASTFVRWGTSQAALDRTAGDVTASETSHVVLLTGLSAGVGVWVEASSTNPCLQSAFVGPTRVVDVDECADGPGCVAPGICVNLVGGFRCEHAPIMADQGFTIDAVVQIGDPVGQIVASDDDGESLQITRISGDEAGALSIATSGVITVASASAVAARGGGAFTFGVRATDPRGRSADATITVSVSPAEDVDECAEDNGGCDQLCADLPIGVACDCEDGFVLSTDGHTCLELGACGAGVSCDPATGPMVFFGVVTRGGDAVGSIKCTREVDGDIHCDVDEDGVLVVSDVLWCAP